MRNQSDRRSFRNEELILKVSAAADRARWNEDNYEPFLDQLCGDREYQKDAIRTTLRYLLGGQYASLRAIARENFDNNDILRERYGSWEGMQRHLQLPDVLSASLDLATGTGKSYVLYAIAAIMLAEGHVDSVLVLCPSTTIETGLLDKFRQLAADSDLQDLLPSTAKITAPSIINASESIVPGSICVENYHAILEHVGSSIRDSLSGKGERVLVLNDETHHVANESGTTPRRWKEFLTNSEYAFRYIIGVSGTCYVGDDYFADVISRYSLRQAMEDRYVKKVDYVAEMPSTGADNEKWQLVRNRHDDIRRTVTRRGIVPLTIIVTQTINQAKNVAEELKAFLMESDSLTDEAAEERILCVYNNGPDVPRLPYVDLPNSKIEWIVSVSMLNEGWDVKRVFQIVPHEERAFNSKLLIAQVLGRGLRIPPGFETGKQPEVTVFNHDAWASRIRNLVNEVLEIERRLSSSVLAESQFHFDLHNLDYTVDVTSVKKPMTGPYNLLEKGYVDLAADVAEEDVSGVFVKAATGEEYRWQTTVKHKTYSVEEIAQVMYERLEEADNPDVPDPTVTFRYTDQFPVTRLQEIVRKSLELRGMAFATERARQKFLQALGTLRRTESENVRYTLRADRLQYLSTKDRHGSSVSAAELRRDKTYFCTDHTSQSLPEEQREFFDEATEPGSGYKVYPVTNRLDFKTPLNAAIADSHPERAFIRELLEPNNLSSCDSWIKSAFTSFYEIEYAWKKGDHPKRGKFSPDFFVKAGDLILVVEIKYDDEIADPSDENRMKHRYAREHFTRLNDELVQADLQTRYQFNFLTPSSFSTFFTYLRRGDIQAYESELDIKLSEQSSNQT